MTFSQYSHKMFRFCPSSFPLSFPLLPLFLFHPCSCLTFKPSVCCARHYAKGGVKGSLIRTFTVFLKFISTPGMVPGPWALGTQQETKHTLFLLLWGLQCSASHSGNCLIWVPCPVRKAGMGWGGEVIGARTWWGVWSSLWGQGAVTEGFLAGEGHTGTHVWEGTLLPAHLCSII